MKFNSIGKTEIISIIIGILLITIIFVFLFLLILPNTASLPIYANIIGNVAVSCSIWLGCRSIVHYLWKKFPWEKEPVKHLLIEIIVIPLWAMIVMASSYYISLKFNVIDKNTNNAVEITIGILITLLITTIHEGVYFYMQWKQNFALSVKLEKDNLEARYETLKSQLNPHFLFNSLNTLITYVEDNPKATDYIQNLSDFMRYVLKNREKELVYLNEEFDISQKYIFLQKARFGNNLNVEIKISAQYFSFCIPPLSMQMLIENAIKHNVISKDRPLYIKIGVENSNMLFVENNLQVKPSEASTGLGLKNISARYEYLSQQRIEIKESLTKFIVLLPLLKVNL